MTIAIKTSTCALLAACLLLGSTAAARAEYYVPPSNSAVNQYTQSIPSAGGDKSGEGKGVTAAEAIGAGNAKKLHKEGPDGAAAAELAAETAPTPVEADAGEEVAPAPSDEGEQGNKQPKKSGHHAKKPKKKNDGEKKESKPAGGGGSASGPTNGAGSGGAAKGASATGELVSQATGLSGGTLGLFLPLVIAAAIIWSGIYLWRRRRGLDHSAV